MTIHANYFTKPTYLVNTASFLCNMMHFHVILKSRKVLQLWFDFVCASIFNYVDSASGFQMFMNPESKTNILLTDHMLYLFFLLASNTTCDQKLYQYGNIQNTKS